MEKFRPVFKPQTLLVALWLAAAGSLLAWLIHHRDCFTPGVLDMTVPLKAHKLQVFVATGLWLGGMAASLIAILLGITYFLWGRSRSFTIAELKHDPQLSCNSRWNYNITPGLFAVLLLTITVFAGYLRWPAMNHSFWGDESWALCDYVHGKWKPVQKDGSLQDDIRFRQATWEQTFFADHNGNNHWLASILQRSALNLWQQANGLEPWAFSEAAVRSVSLFGGLASIMGLALLLRRLGRPAEGLLAAGILALHPWHVRFSVEARGYGLMLLFFVLILYALVNVLERNRRRDWLGLALAQFLILYTWKGAVYPLAFMNLAVGIILCTRRFNKNGDRLLVISRWVAANMMGAMLFLPLSMPSQLQVRKSMDDLRGRAKPMDVNWANDTVAGIVTGMPYHEQDAGNPHEVSIQRVNRAGAFYPVGFALMALVTLLGLFVWMRRRGVLAAVLAAVLFSAFMAALHFKYGLHVELLHWYLLYCVPVVAMLAAAGIMTLIMALHEVTVTMTITMTSLLLVQTKPHSQSQSHRQHHRSGMLAVSCMLVLIFMVLGAYRQLWTAPLHEVQTRSKEDHKGAWLATRGQAESSGYTGPSRIYTAWLWRHSYLYDPRGDVFVRDEASLRTRMNEAAARNGEFYMIIGNSQLCDLLCPGMMKVLRNPEEFDHVQTLWGMEQLNTLYVYHMRKAPLHKTLVKD